MESNKRVAVLTDTNCDLPQEYYEKYPIFRLPLVICSGLTEYKDGVNITVQEVYARQKNEDFKTSLPHRGDVEATLDTIREAGYTQVIVLLLGGALSGAGGLLRIVAQERTDLDIAVFDSCSASAGVGMLALQTAQYAARGLPFHLLKKLAAQLVTDTKVFFSLDTLEYLQRGGRIGRATAIAGTLLQIKPVLSFDETGTIYTAAKVRGRRGVPERLIQLVTDYKAAHGGNARFNLMVCDGDAPQEGAALEAALVKALPGAEQVLHCQLDAALAVHLGPHLLGTGIQFLRTDLPRR